MAFYHKLSTRIVRGSQAGCAEGLKVKGLLGNRTLAIGIADAGWGELLRQLEHNARRHVVQIGRLYPSSRRCQACGRLEDRLPLEAPALDRNVHAAENIRDAGLPELAAGVAVSACGGDVGPTRIRVGEPRRSRKPR